MQIAFNKQMLGAFYSDAGRSTTDPICDVPAHKYSDRLGLQVDALSCVCDDIPHDRDVFNSIGARTDSNPAVLNLADGVSGNYNLTALKEVDANIPRRIGVG